GGPEDARDRLRGSGEHHEVRDRRDVGRVVLVRQQVARLREQMLGPNDLPEFVCERGAGSEADAGGGEAHIGRGFLHTVGSWDALQAEIPPTRSVTSPTP